jgi:serine/threonine protein phosphatase PrpC
MALCVSHTSVLETQATRKQDAVFTGKRSNGDVWYAVFDGHGGDTVIDAIRELDFLQIMDKENPAREISDIIGKLPDTFGTGATMSIVLISPTEIQCYWRGDSTIKIYKDGEEHFVSEDHSFQNATEMDRIKPLGIKTEPSWRTKILSPTSITMEPSPYFILDCIVGHGPFNRDKRDMTNMTNCLGHNNKLGDTIQEEVILTAPYSLYTIIIATDGFWDIVAPQDEHIPSIESALDLTDFALGRWEQDWTYEYPGSETCTRKLTPRDDIAVGIWRGQFVHLD